MKNLIDIISEKYFYIVGGNGFGGKCPYTLCDRTVPPSDVSPHAKKSVLTFNFMLVTYLVIKFKVVDTHDIKPYIIIF